VRLDAGAWTRGGVWRWIQEAGNIADAEMHRTFNCGIGMTLQVAASDADRALAALTAAGEEARVSGAVAAGDRGVVFD
ncbi:MAG: phosphoribosylformylglycinamidine cyclo-ligase, partial [Chromatiales bacterium]